MMKMNDFRTRFRAIHYIALVEAGVENDENERLPNPVFSDSLYSFGAKQVSEMMKMNDFQTRF